MNKRRVSKYTLVSLGAALALVVVAVLAFAGGLALSPRLYAVAQAADEESVIELTSTMTAEPILELDDILATFEGALVGVYETTVPSVVDIEVTQRVTSGTTNPFGGGSGDLFRQGEGSGFVWDEEGHIVTNYHVVEDAETVKVIFADGRDTPAEVIGTDPDTDLAVLKVNLPASELQPLVLGDSDDLKVGQLTLAIGNPYGQDFTMTSGIVSAVGRTILSGNSSFSIPEVIQTDAAINPGNSGGPLLNRQGEVIGINTMIISQTGSSSGVGFAIPINIAKQILPTLIAGEGYEYAWLGISGAGLVDEVTRAMNLPADTQGVLIISVVQNSPAAEAGLRSSQELLTVTGQDYPYGGDIITAIQGESIADMDNLITYLVDNTRPGDQVTLSLIRSDGVREDVSVNLGARPKN
jgi:S1-C subfamily serine protease